MGVGVGVATTVSGEISINQIIADNRPIAVGTQTGVSQNALTTVATLGSNSNNRYITKVICSGEENGRWELYIDSVLKVTKRTTDRQVDFDFNLPLKISSTEVVDIKVIHFGPDASADFNATILGYTEIA